MTVQTIIRAVAQVYQVTSREILGRSRTEQIANARQAAMALAYEMTPLGASRIGRAFNRDHATVLWAVKAIQDRIQTDGNSAKWLATVRAKLKTS